MCTRACVHVCVCVVTAEWSFFALTVGRFAVLFPVSFVVVSILFLREFHLIAPSTRERDVRNTLQKEK